MRFKPRWETRQCQCPESGRPAELQVEWQPDKGRYVVHAVHCDHPLLHGIEGWDCQWSCWEAIEKAIAEPKE
jgi:hypothetical protein